MLTIAWTHLLKMLKDRRAIIGIFSAPILIMAFFGFMFRQSDTSSPVTLGLGIADLSASSPAAQSLISALESTNSFSVSLLEDSELRDLVGKQKLKIGLVIPKDYSLGMPLELIQSDPAAAGVLYQSLSQSIVALQTEGLTDQHPEVVRVSLEKVDADLSMILGFVINFMLFSMIYLATEISEIRRSTILRRIFTAPYKPLALMTGLAASMFVLLAVQIILINICSYLLFGQWLMVGIVKVALLMIPFIMFILATGLLISRIVKKPDFMALAVNLIIMPLGMISGTFLPTGITPEFLTRFAFLTPQYWLVRGLNPEVSLTAIGPNLLILTLMAACVLSVSSYNAKQWVEA